MIKSYGIFCLIIASVRCIPVITSNDRGTVDSYGNPIPRSSLVNTIIDPNNLDYVQQYPIIPYQPQSTNQQPIYTTYNNQQPQQQQQQNQPQYQQQPQPQQQYQQHQQQPHYQQQQQHQQQQQPIQGQSTQYTTSNSPQIDTSFIPRPQFNAPEFNDIFSKYVSEIQQNFANLYQQHSNFVNQQKFASNIFPDVNAQFNQGYNSGFSSATGAFGPSGVHQTAYINPSNPNSPNVNAYYDSQSGGSGGGGGQPNFYGVATSSFSASSDVNGIKSNQRGAYTTVNDNGKVTSYKVES